MIIYNSKYKIEFDNNGRIVSLVCREKEFVKEVLPLFQFRLRNGGEASVISSDGADEITFSPDKDKLVFSFNYKELNISFTAEVICADRIEFLLSFENKTGSCVEWVDYPQIAVPNDLVAKGGSGKLLIDLNEGLIVEDMEALEAFEPYKYKEMEYPSQGLYGMFPAAVESQFLAYYDDNCGIYIAAEDKERAIKGVNFAPLGNDAIKMLFRLYPGIDSLTERFAFSFAMVIDFFNGDWYGAAELYRNWFDNNLPENLRKVKENRKLPEWYFDSPLVVAYPVQGIHDMDEAKPNRLFPYNNALPYLDDIADKTGSRVMAALMHWEGTAPWAPPYVWPPLGGEDMLREFCDELHSRNFILGVYCSGISYTIHSNINDYNNEEAIEKDGLKRFMCSPPDGGKPVSEICQAQRKSYDMCISQDFTKDVLCEEAQKMASCGLDYIQILDQNHGGTPYFCYSDKHGHPPVPGKWMVENMTDFLKKLKTAVGDKILLGCESASSEAYTPYLNLSDNRFNLNYAVGKPVPLYGYIYHRYLHNFSGNSVCSLDFIDIHRSPDCHLLRIAHSYLAGDLMTLVINQDGDIVWSWGERDFSLLPERKPIMEFIKSATAYRRGVGKEYLLYGKMIKPLSVKCESVPMYKPGSEKYVEYPSVLTSAWQADDGTKAQFFASYRKQDEKITIDLSGYNGAELLDENGNIILELCASMCEITIPAHSVRMLSLK